MTPQPLRFPRPVQCCGSQDQSEDAGTQTRVTGNCGGLNVIPVHGIVAVLAVFAVSRAVFPISRIVVGLSVMGSIRVAGTLRDGERRGRRLKIGIRLALRRELCPVGFTLGTGLENGECQSLSCCIGEPHAELEGVPDAVGQRFNSRKNHLARP